MLRYQMLKSVRIVKGTVCQCMCSWLQLPLFLIMNDRSWNCSIKGSSTHRLIELNVEAKLETQKKKIEVEIDLVECI